MPALRVQIGRISSSHFHLFFFVPSLCNVCRDVNRCALLIFRSSWKYFRAICFPFETQSGLLLLLLQIIIIIIITDPPGPGEKKKLAALRSCVIFSTERPPSARGALRGSEMDASGVKMGAWLLDHPSLRSIIDIMHLLAKKTFYQGSAGSCSGKKRET